jgi:hypothetical protein
MYDYLNIFVYMCDKVVISFSHDFGRNFVPKT